MITRDAHIERHSHLTTPLPVDPSDGELEAFGEIIKGIEGSRNKAVVPLLSKIESNTASLLRGTRTQKAADRPVRIAVAETKLKRSSYDRPRDEKGRFVATKAQPVNLPSSPVVKTSSLDDAVTQDRISPSVSRSSEGQIKRDSKGRFLSKSQLAHEQQVKKKDQKTIVASITSGFAGFAEKGKSAVETGTVGEAAGVAAGGPVFEAAMEIKEAVDGARSEDSLIGKTARKIGMIAGLGKETPTVEETAKEGRDEKGRFVKESLGKSEKEEQKRHKELIETIKENSGKGGGNGGGLGLGLGFTGKKALGGIARLAKPLSGLARLSGPALALAGAGAVGYGVGTGINALLNKITEAVTGKKGYTPADVVYDKTAPKINGVKDIIGAVESGGRGGYGAYNNRDSGIVSAGRYQFSAAGGQSSSLASVFEKYAAGGGARAEEARKYAAIMRKGGQAAESLRNDPQLRSFITKTGNEATMRKAQEDVFTERYFNPAIGYAQKQGVNTIKMPKLTGMMVDTKIQGGLEDVTKRTSVRLAAQGKTFQTASEDEIMDVFTDERKKRLDRIAASKASRGDAKSAAILAQSKKRVGYVHEMLDKNETSLQKGSYDIAEAKGKLGPEAQPAPRPAPVPVPEVATVISNPIADARSRIKKKTKARPERQYGNNVSTVAVATPVGMTRAEPVKTIDGKIDPKPVARPERLKPESVAFKAKQAPTATQNAGNQDLSKLIASLSQLASSMEAGGKDGEAQKNGNPGMNIRTEFDDTMLTLMAYDRV